MHFNKLITMGCSWTAGNGDSLNKSGWVGRIFDKFSEDNSRIRAEELDNLGVMGDSNWIQYAQLLKYLNQPECLVIWGMTAFSRDIFCINNEWQTSYVHDKRWKNYYREYDDAAAQLKTIILLHSFQEFVKQHQSEYLIFLSFDDISRLDGSYDLGKFNHMYNLINWENVITDYSMCDYINGNFPNYDISEDAQEYFMGQKKDLLPSHGHYKTKPHKNFAFDGHPNSNGYELWANHLYDILYDIMMKKY